MPIVLADVHSLPESVQDLVLYRGDESFIWDPRRALCKETHSILCFKFMRYKAGRGLLCICVCSISVEFRRRKVLQYQYCISLCQCKFYFQNIEHVACILENCEFVVYFLSPEIVMMRVAVLIAIVLLGLTDRSAQVNGQQRDPSACEKYHW